MATRTLLVGTAERTTTLLRASGAPLASRRRCWRRRSSVSRPAVALSETRIELERLYYERIGVDSDISVYGFLPAHFAVTVSAHFAGTVATRGWTFSLGTWRSSGWTA